MQEAASLVVIELLDAAVDEEDITEAMVKYLLAKKLKGMEQERHKAVEDLQNDDGIDQVDP